MSVALVKPSTPVVIKFSDGKKVTLHADIAVRLWPMFAESVKALTTTVDKKDNKARALLDLTGNATPPINGAPLSAGAALMLASYACGGAYESACYALFKKFGLPVPDLTTAITTPDLSLQIKGNCTSGAMLMLCIKGVQDQYWATGCKCVKTFGGAFPEMPDGFYSVATQTLMPDKKGVFTIARMGDLAHTFVLKAELVGPVDLDTLFQSVSLSTGGSQFVEIDLQTNNALAKAYGLWPSKNNDSPKKPNQKWVAVIPIVIRETTAYTKIVKPMVALCWHESRIELHGIKEHVEYALDVDYIYMDRAARAWIAQGRDPKDQKEEETKSKDKAKDQEKEKDSWDCRPQEDWSDDDKLSKDIPMVPEIVTDTKQKLTKSPPTPFIPKSESPIRQCSSVTAARNPLAGSYSGHNFFFTQYQTVREFLSAGNGKTRRISLGSVMHHPTSGFIITLSPEEPAIKQPGLNAAPILGAAIEFNGNRAMEFDFVDMTEWNWIKCGMKPPTDSYTLLLPASREMFWADQKDDVFVCPTTVNLSRLDSVVLTLTVNEELLDLCGWNVGITAVSTNTSKCSMGMEGMKFSS